MLRKEDLDSKEWNKAKKLLLNQAQEEQNIFSR